jgi:predicted enzyme related to lactoylglutathione lyase
MFRDTGARGPPVLADVFVACAPDPGFKLDGGVFVERGERGRLRFPDEQPLGVVEYRLQGCVHVFPLENGSRPVSSRCAIPAGRALQTTCITRGLMASGQPLRWRRCQPARSPSWQDSGMERVLGIGGYFMRAADPAALSAWYRDCLGLDADENGLWRQEAGLTVFATFDSGTGYFGSPAQQTMLNFRVRDLDAMLAQLRAKGADVARETQDMEGVGRFGWVTDPEGNRVELWQPA